MVTNPIKCMMSAGSSNTIRSQVKYLWGTQLAVWAGFRSFWAMPRVDVAVLWTSGEQLTQFPTKARRLIRSVFGGTLFRAFKRKPPILGPSSPLFTVMASTKEGVWLNKKGTDGASRRFWVFILLLLCHVKDFICHSGLSFF